MSNPKCTFTNVKFNDRIDRINTVQKDKMKNPYYAFAEASKTVVTYYHINKPKSTLDEGAKFAYNWVGKDSPIRFDKILKFPLYGIDKIVPDMEIGEYGLQSRDIEGDALVLPNSITPTPNDFFIIDYISGKLLFRVTNVTPNTIENDNLMYKISYKLDNSDGYAVIDKQVINIYECIGNGNNGLGIRNDYQIIIKSDDARIIDKIDYIANKITQWYIDLFYNNRLEVFLVDNFNWLYDEYLTEFIIRNRIISANAHKIHVMHQTTLPRTFSVDYEKTIFRFIETRKGDISDYVMKASYEFIDELGSTLTNRYYDYFKAAYLFDYTVYQVSQVPVISVLDNETVYQLEKNEKSNHGTYKDIIVKYIYGENITDEDLNILDKTPFKPTLEFFYSMPILIYILRNYSNSLLNAKTLE